MDGGAAPFIAALPADEVVPGSGVPGAEVLVQGIADLVLVFDDHAEILDYKTDKSRGMDKKGVGLGLHIVKTIIMQHGGEINAESVEEYIAVGG